MCGKPTLVRTCFTQPERRKGSSTLGQRAASKEEQQRQVALLIDCATTDMSTIIGNKSTSKVISLESAVDQAQSCCDSTAESVADKVLVAAQTMALEEVESPYPSISFFLVMMFELGRATAKLDLEERQFAAGFIAVCLEYLLVGGQVDQARIMENFEANVRRQDSITALKNSTSCKRLIASAGARDGWHEKLLLPVRTMLTQLETSGVLEALPGAGGIFKLVDGQHQSLHTFRRFFGSGADALRRCIDRYERTRPLPAACAAKPRKSPSEPVSNPWTHIVHRG